MSIPNEHPPLSQIFTIAPEVLSGPQAPAFSMQDDLTRLGPVWIAPDSADDNVSVYEPDAGFSLSDFLHEAAFAPEPFSEFGNDEVASATEITDGAAATASAAEAAAVAAADGPSATQPAAEAAATVSAGEESATVSAGEEFAIVRTNEASATTPVDESLAPVPAQATATPAPAEAPTTTTPAADTITPDAALAHAWQVLLGGLSRAADGTWFFLGLPVNWADPHFFFRYYLPFDPATLRPVIEPLFEEHLRNCAFEAALAAAAQMQPLDAPEYGFAPADATFGLPPLRPSLPSTSSSDSIATVHSLPNDFAPAGASDGLAVGTPDALATSFYGTPASQSLPDLTQSTRREQKARRPAKRARLDEAQDTTVAAAGSSSSSSSKRRPLPPSAYTSRAKPRAKSPRFNKPQSHAADPAAHTASVHGWTGLTIPSDAHSAAIATPEFTFAGVYPAPAPAADAYLAPAPADAAYFAPAPLAGAHLAAPAYPQNFYFGHGAPQHFGHGAPQYLAPAPDSLVNTNNVLPPPEACDDDGFPAQPAANTQLPTPPRTNSAASSSDAAASAPSSSSNTTTTSTTTTTTTTAPSPATVPDFKPGALDRIYTHAGRAPCRRAGGCPSSFAPADIATRPSLLAQHITHDHAAPLWPGAHAAPLWPGAHAAPLGPGAHAAPLGPGAHARRRYRCAWVGPGGRVCGAFAGGEGDAKGIARHVAETHLGKNRHARRAVGAVPRAAGARAKRP
ncbi:hypothetical protein HDZ31DRAFT_73737 [Schizophyllum fasciatum]